MTTRIELENGKYTVCHDNGTNLRALRHGEDWRSLTGDGLVLAMAQRIEELEAFLTLLKHPENEYYNSAIELNPGRGPNGDDIRAELDRLSP